MNIGPKIEIDPFRFSEEEILLLPFFRPVLFFLQAKIEDREKFFGFRFRRSRIEDGGGFFDFGFEDRKGGFSIFGSEEQRRKEVFSSSKNPLFSEEPPFFLLSSFFVLRV